MARGRKSPKARSAGSYTGDHGDSVAGLPGQPEIKVSGSGGGAGAGGPKKVKGPGANASIKGKTKGMGGK